MVLIFSSKNTERTALFLGKTVIKIAKELV
jgi:hypothetical protein